MHTAIKLARVALRATGAQGSPAVDSVLDAYIEAIRADVRTNSIEIITNTMQFCEKDAAIFWPLYEKYRAELPELNDERADIIRAYAAKLDTMTDEDAKSLMQRWINAEGRKVELRKEYLVEFNKVLPGTTVAKFFQIVHRLDLMVDLKISSELPQLRIKRPTLVSRTHSGANQPGSQE